MKKAAMQLSRLYADRSGSICSLLQAAFRAIGVREYGVRSVPQQQRRNHIKKTFRINLTVSQQTL